MHFEVALKLQGGQAVNAFLQQMLAFFRRNPFAIASSLVAILL